MSSKKGLALLCAAVLVTTMAAAAGAQEASSKVGYVPGSFPGAGVDVITHRLTIGLYSVTKSGQQGDLLETLVFKGRMLVERGDPYVNKLGFRQVAFLVKNWEAYAWSQKLNSLVVYSLAKVPQKMSTITAQQRESDYPASFHFSVTFNANAFGQQLNTDPYPGEPEGDGFMEVPPSGNRRTSPALSRFEATRIKADHPTLGSIMFVPMACGDEEGSTLVTYSDEQKKSLRLPRAAS
ncbi:MAG TPA: hypothetical protein VLV54_04490 [Thermoanaerobaculia bacterium]|nr:hypothetical protein [Thermoanaerobaculia bacterium]